jgi:hypothetical protein
MYSIRIHKNRGVDFYISKAELQKQHFIPVSVAALVTLAEARPDK